MRTLLLLRGSAGVGKSTWIKENGLENYTLSADDIRMQCAAPVMTVSGKEAINPSNDKVVWKTLFNLLELRMQNGEFTVIDATNSKTSEINRYKNLCSSYKYRIFCVDFTDVPIEIAKERNLMRPELKQVPEDAIDKMYSRFETQKIPTGVTVIKPNELDKIWMKKIDLSHYKKIHHIGDIHGCYTALKEYFERNGGYKEDEFYIFCGDYIDRGIENAEVIKFLLSIYNKPNVLLLEGNHERLLWLWANDASSKSRDFELMTKTELDKAKIDKKAVRQLYRKIAQCAYYTYAGNTYLVCHGGLSGIPKNLTTVSTRQLIQGVGYYNDAEATAMSFVANTPEDCFLIHGHRNPKALPIQVNERVFNLEGHVEHGGSLRCVQILPNGAHSVYEIVNTVFNKPELSETGCVDQKKQTVGDTVLALRQNKYVQEKQYGDISSFNFTKSAFYEKIWDDQTTKARGLFINVPKQKIVARAYEKFFNINERPETKFDILQNKLEFPVTAYVKENGFLGLVAYNEEDNSLFVTTKSAPDGDFAHWFNEVLIANVGLETLELIKEYSQRYNVTFVFECVDMKHDPHIIEYAGNQVFLLDIVYNDLDFHKFPYSAVCDVANTFGLTVKEKAYVIHSWSEFFDWYYEVTDADYKYLGRDIEGFVIEDASGYMIKLKLCYYNFWKYMRSIAHEAIRKGYIDPRRTSGLVTPLANHFYGWVKTLHDCENLEAVPRDICTLRKMFFETEIGKKLASEPCE